MAAEEARRLRQYNTALAMSRAAAKAGARVQAAARAAEEAAARRRRRWWPWRGRRPASAAAAIEEARAQTERLKAESERRGGR